MFPMIPAESRAAAMADVDFRLTTVRVSGRVIGDVEALFPTQGRGGAPLLQGADPRLASESGTPRASLDRDGAFQFGAVPPGTYRLAVAQRMVELVPRRGAAPSGTDHPNVATLAAGILLSGEIIVGDDDISGVQLRAARTMKFPVTVKVEGGGPTPPFQLRFEDASPKEKTPPITVEAGSKDSFEVQLPDLQFRLVLPEAPPGFYLKSATLVYPSGGTTSILQKPFIVHQTARMAIVLGRDAVSGGSKDIEGR
jgi:hypothetical protein